MCSSDLGQSESGMFTMNQSLMKLVTEGTISEEGAMDATTVPDELVRLLTGMGGMKKK